jgi:hypothetical protein
MAASFMVENSWASNWQKTWTLQRSAPPKLASQGGKAYSSDATVPFGDSAATLTFQRSPAVSVEVRESIVSSLLKNDPSLQRRQLETDFTNDQILNAFDHLLSKFGYSGTNVVDTLAAFYIVSWELVNNADASHNIQGIRATHDKLLHAALNNPKLTSLSNDEKQKFAETLAYQVVLTGAAKNELIREGDTARLQQLRGQVRTAAMKLGPDPYTLKLTDQGLVPKS